MSKLMIHRSHQLQEIKDSARKESAEEGILAAAMIAMMKRYLKGITITASLTIHNNNRYILSLNNSYHNPYYNNQGPTLGNQNRLSNHPNTQFRYKLHPTNQRTP
jgi:hypothetical protein